MTKSENPSRVTKYRLKFLPAALKEWEALDGSVKGLPGSELHGDLQGCYKVKLRQQGYRLVYSVEDDVLVVLVLAVDKREDMAAYRSALQCLISTVQ